MYEQCLISHGLQDQPNHIDNSGFPFSSQIWQNFSTSSCAAQNSQITTPIAISVSGHHPCILSRTERFTYNGEWRVGNLDPQVMVGLRQKHFLLM